MTHVADPGAELLGLQVDQAPVRAQLDQMLVDLLGDAAHHFARLQHGHHVAHRDRVLHFEAGQLGQRVVEADPEALLGGQGLAGAVDQPPRRLAGVLQIVAVDGDGGHGLGHGDHRDVDGAGHPLGRAVPGAGLGGGDARVGNEMHVGPGDARGVTGQNDGAVHFGQLGQPLRAVLRIEQETPGADGQDARIVTQDDQRPVLGLQNAIETLAEGSPGRDQRASASFSGWLPRSTTRAWYWPVLRRAYAPAPHPCRAGRRRRAWTEARGPW